MKDSFSYQEAVEKGKEAFREQNISNDQLYEDVNKIFAQYAENIGASTALDDLMTPENFEDFLTEIDYMTSFGGEDYA
jgi:hypothetical protein